MTATEVAPGIHRIHSAEVVNWYLLHDGGRFAAYDAGLPPDWEELKRTIESLGGSLDALEAVVLTHAHIDHTGIAERARSEAGARVYAHEKESPLMRSQLRMAKSERNPLLYARYGATRKLMFTMIRTGAFQTRPIRDFDAYTDGDVLEAVPGRPRVVFTPGHTFGHSALHLADRDVLITGDALVTRNPYTGATGPQIVARAATADSDEALSSLDRIAATGAGTLLPGHGDPWTAGAEAAAQEARAAGKS